MIVVDTNVIIYLILRSDFAELSLNVRRKDRHWLAPMLWRSEFRNALIGYRRRGSMSLSDLIESSELAESRVESRHVDDIRVIELAVQSGCTAYDCEFVSLAEGLSVPLVTSDKKLLAAFPEIAVSMDAFVT